MPQQWTWPAYVAVIGGTFLFLLFFLPIVLFQSRRYGRLSWRRLVVAAALSVYGVALVAYTLLPLPSDTVAWCARYGFDSAQLRPFQFVADIRRETAGMGIEATLRSRSVLQVVFNVLLFVPWGVIVRRFFGRGFWFTVVTGFAASVLIEVTQYTGIFGLIGCSYRVADVDDVMTNTLGAVVGAVVAPVVLRWIPRPSDLVRERDLPRRVTVWRRWTGQAVDLALFVTLGMTLQIGYRLTLALLGRELPLSSPGADFLLGAVVPGLVVFVVPAFLGTGASWGQRAMWLRPTWGAQVAGETDGSALLGDGTLPRRVTRMLATGGLFALLTMVQAFPSASDDLQQLAGLLSWLLVVVAFFAVLFSRGRRGLSYAVAGARLVDARSGMSASEATVKG